MQRHAEELSWNGWTLRVTQQDIQASKAGQSAKIAFLQPEETKENALYYLSSCDIVSLTEWFCGLVQELDPAKDTSALNALLHPHVRRLAQDCSQADVYKNDNFILSFINGL